MNEASDKSATFEEALAELEVIVRALESGDLALEEALTRYEAGVALLKRCYGHLKQAEQRILVLTGENAEGKPTTQVFAPSAAGDPEPPRQSRTTAY